jgi:hypothetical protein
LKNLTPADLALLRHLRQAVDRLQEERFRKDRHVNVEQDYWRAKKELKNFVTEKRKQGVNI